jgi:hypothetical protein
MRRQTPSIKNPRYPLAFRIYLALGDHPSAPWTANSLPFRLENSALTSLLNHGFIISRGKRNGKGGTPANVWVFDAPVLEQLRFLAKRQQCTHIKKEDSLFGEVYCRRLKHKMSLAGCKECLKYTEETGKDYFPQSVLQRFGLMHP